MVLTHQIRRETLFEFPPKLDEAIHAIAADRKARVAKNTHYDAVNRELRWFDDNTYHRISFDFDGAVIRATGLLEIYPFCARSLVALRNTYLVSRLRKIEWKALGELPPGQERGFYEAKIQTFIARVGRGEVTNRVS